MAEKVLSAGDVIDSRCTKCKTVTNHTIIAMTGDTPAKVECNTCNGQHKYRPPVAPKKPTTRRAAVPKVSPQNEWLKRETEIRSAKPVIYNMQASFKVGAVIDHPSFGLGLVQSQPGPNKVEVLFEAGKKIMRCG